MTQKPRSTIAFAIFVLSCLIQASPAEGSAEKTVTPSTVYISRIPEGMVAVIDANTDRLIAFIRTGTNPAEIGVVESLNRAFVADLSENTVTVVDTVSETVVATIDVLFGDGFELGNTAPWSSSVP